MASCCLKEHHKFHRARRRADMWTFVAVCVHVCMCSWPRNPTAPNTAVSTSHRRFLPFYLPPFPTFFFIWIIPTEILPLKTTSTEQRLALLHPSSPLHTPTASSELFPAEKIEGKSLLRQKKKNNNIVLHFGCLIYHSPIEEEMEMEKIKKHTHLTTVITGPAHRIVSPLLNWLW